MAKKIVLIVLAILLLIGIVLYFARGFETGSDTASSTDNNASSGDATTLREDTPEETAENEAASNEAISGARAIVNERREAYTEMAEKLTSREHTLQRDAFIDKASTRLDVVTSEVMLALRGDDAAAQKLLSRARECRQFNPMTPMDIETEISYYQNRFERSRNITDQQRQNQEQRIQQTRKAMEKRVEDCSWRHSVEFPNLRTQVEQQADSGDVMARFYYAMLLKPSPYEVDYLLETAAWSDNSLRFTMANINQNMTAGYLALSFSHAQGIFTHQDARLAGIWAYLVMSCPMSGPIAAPYLNTLLSNDRMEFLSATTIDIGQVWAQQVCPL